MRTGKEPEMAKALVALFSATGAIAGASQSEIDVWVSDLGR